MSKFLWVSGPLAEVQRFINVPMRWCEQYPARERRELWVTTADGLDIKLIVHSRLMQARRGHQVIGLLLGEQRVGIYNATTASRSTTSKRSAVALAATRCSHHRLAVGHQHHRPGDVGVGTAVGWRAAGVALRTAGGDGAPALEVPDKGTGRSRHGDREVPDPRTAAAASGEVVQREPVRSAGPCDTVAVGRQLAGKDGRHYIQSDETSTLTDVRPLKM